ncbi:MAG: hypothetical protein VKL39_20510 [Leptolyngbyaceae bacterium]|nr:hypothetical protein [Leptolyngbyaceae bacterium]
MAEKEELDHNLAVYDTPWGLCVTVDELAPCTDKTAEDILALVGDQAHYGWYNGAMRTFIELDAIEPSPNAKLTFFGTHAK